VTELDEIVEVDEIVELQRQQVEELIPFAESFNGDDQWEEARQFYGDPLSCLMGAGGPWLEVAVLGGHVPDLASIALAVRANHVLALSELRACVGDEPPSAKTVSAAYRREYQELSELIGGFLAELEEQPNDLTT
jgi:hypothetical protein